MDINCNKDIVCFNIIYAIKSLALEKDKQQTHSTDKSDMDWLPSETGQENFCHGL